MTDLHSTVSLTENEVERAKAERAKMLDPYHMFLVNSKYLTVDEAFELQDMRDDVNGGIGPKTYKWETTNQRISKMNRFLELLDKIDLQTVNTHWNTIYMKMKLSRTKHAAHDLGAREFTLTYSPKWFSDEEARRQMRRAIERICKYYKDGDQRIIKLRAIGEVGSNGLSHVHCFYKLLGGVKITDKNFKRAYPSWDPKVKQGPSGHKGGHHANVKHDADFLGYIEKQVDSAWLDISVGVDENPE